MWEADAGTPLEVPRPVLFYTYKQHAGEWAEDEDLGDDDGQELPLIR
jgi:hypothetical protein